MSKRLMTILVIVGLATILLIFLGYKDYQRQSKIEMKLKSEKIGLSIIQERTIG